MKTPPVFSSNYESSIRVCCKLRLWQLKLTGSIAFVPYFTGILLSENQNILTAGAICKLRSVFLSAIGGGGLFWVVDCVNW